MQIPFPIIFNHHDFRVDTFSNVMRDFVFFFFSSLPLLPPRRIFPFIGVVTRAKFSSSLFDRLESFVLCFGKLVSGQFENKSGEIRDVLMSKHRCTCIISQLTRNRYINNMEFYFRFKNIPRCIIFFFFFDNTLERIHIERMTLRHGWIQTLGISRNV